MEQLTIDGNPVEKTINLRCFRVDDHDYYAAADEAEALRLHSDLTGIDCEEVDSCTEVVGELLDKPWQEEDKPGVSVGTLRQWLAEAREPGWLAGTE
ncbi:TPA: hypothetical protein QEM39_000384 [Pseudomonas putida]|uniref:hypothetical protein n=1 Tax=Pseudomonas putida TaxID=303 RepID=UPI00236393FE|nr:hypothetical protein [Pseudomonas putida]MDD2152275.1 hypothetical protein [Pseudomonas putida]HDS1678916.1 hypothetical protein [Pseudomonas putida]